MKIKLIEADYKKVCTSQPYELKDPKKPNIFWRTLMKLVAMPDLMATHFKCEKVNMDKIEKGQPCLVFMNHSAFIDLEIVAQVMYPRPFNIVATTDGYVGKNWLMRQIGCIPTKKIRARNEATQVYEANALGQKFVRFDIPRGRIYV